MITKYTVWIITVDTSMDYKLTVILTSHYIRYYTSSILQYTLMRLDIYLQDHNISYT